MELPVQKYQRDLMGFAMEIKGGVLYPLLLAISTQHAQRTLEHIFQEEWPDGTGERVIRSRERTEEGGEAA